MVYFTQEKHKEFMSQKSQKHNTYYSFLRKTNLNLKLRKLYINFIKVFLQSILSLFNLHDNYFMNKIFE